MPVSPHKKDIMGAGPAPHIGGRQVESGKATPPAPGLNQHEKGAARPPEPVRQVESGSVPYDRMGQPSKGASEHYDRSGQCTNDGGGKSYDRQGQPK